MGIFDALNTSVGGLQAQSFALQNISGNIANASTTGYKGIDTSFEDLIPDATTPNRQVAGGVTAFAQQTITTQGTVSASTVATNMAINGDGFFSVQKPTGVVDNVPVFTGVTDYTRRGDFQVNANGNLVNGAGYYLMGVDGRPQDRQPDRQRAAGAAIPEQLHSGAGDQRDPVCREPADAAEDAGKLHGGRRHAHGGRRPQPGRLRLATRCRSARRRRPSPTTPSPAPPSSNQAATPAPITAATALSGTAPVQLAADQLRRRRHHHGRRHARITFVSAGTDLAGNQHRRHRQRRHAADQDRQRSPASRRPSTPRPARSRCTPAPRRTCNITSASRRRFPRSASSSPVTAARGGGGTAGTGVVIGNDLTTFTNEIDHRRRGDRLQCGRHAGEPAIALGQDRQRGARRRPSGRLESVLSDQHHRDRHRRSPGSTSAPTSPSAPTAR